MKILAHTILTIVGLMFLIVTGGSAYAQSYLGEVCWLVQQEGEEGTTILKLAAENVGEDHFTLSGLAFSADEGITTESEFLNGSAEVVSDQVIMTLSGTSSSADEFVSMKYHTQLPIPSLNGTFEGAGSIYDKQSDETIDEYASGTLTLTDCP